MPRSPRAELSSDDLRSASTQIVEDARADRHDAAWKGVKSLLREQRGREDVALALVRIVDEGHLSRERSLEVLEKVYGAHHGSETILAGLGEALESARDVDFLNSPPPEHPLFANVVGKLSALASRSIGSDIEASVLRGLSTAARMMARQHDALVENACRRLIELEPDNSSLHYRFGLFCKTRGRFRDGMVANRTAAALVDEPREAIEWNLGICATGAAEAEIALQVWKRIGQRIEIGRFGLPDGRYGQCKVRLAQRPLAERTADADDPGIEETIWIDRLSPCHGIIRSVLYQDLGVDYGDVILFDGAPITHHTYGDQQIPVFPHLATLLRNHYQLFCFAGTQEESEQIARANADLPGDTMIYPHSENFIRLCEKCWRNPDSDRRHRHSDRDAADTRIVTGKIAAAPDVDAGELLKQIDAAMAKREPCRVFSPELCTAAGLKDRAIFERRRFEMLTARSTSASHDGHN
jgi:hypothetical protein